MKNMDIIPDDFNSLVEYLESCFEDLKTFTSDISQKIIKERIRKSSLKLSTLND